MLVNGSIIIIKFVFRDIGFYKCFVDYDGGWLDSVEVNFIVMG